MAKIFFDEDGDLSLFEGKKLAVLGYGNQGRSQALNRFLARRRLAEKLERQRGEKKEEEDRIRERIRRKKARTKRRIRRKLADGS